MIEQREAAPLEAADSSAASTIPPSPQMRGRALATQAPEPRDWVLPGADEIFRGIYTRAGTGASEVLAVCSAITGEGKTTVSLGLATAIAQDFPERRVLVVETDVQRPVLATDFDVDPNPGLIECLLEEEPIQRAYRRTHLENLHLVPAGGPAVHEGRLLRTNHLVAMIQAMRETHDVIVLDVPAVLANSDALLLSDLADGILFVVRAGTTPNALVRKAIDQIDHGKLRGIVLNGARSAVPNWIRRLFGL